MNKAILIPSVLILLLFTLDFSNRLILESTKVDNDFNQKSLKVMPLPLLSETTRQTLEQAYKKYSQPVQNTQVAEKGLSAAKQAEQNGELISVFAGDYELKLKAVITTNEPYVLIEQKNINDDNTQLVKYSDMQIVHGYSLKVLSNTEVELTKGQQNITLIMYQRG
ncbi:hypothetical protein [Pseudoalteromonas gelatinilytica]|uniref:Uncharacterized protein n=1 Tax=Pseudoalteromonas gelatinilytica TaxID=1703256 RepID=A0A3A3EVD8_9GAMM|nr:hypothetical protein [Pseudoalteromonas profundi]RJF38021.1 hypothetical protein D4741_08150 [Pseudoalteromonas profundi]